MKKYLYTLLFCLFLTGNVHSHGSFRYGALAGLSSTGIRLSGKQGEYFNGYDRAIGFNVNAYLAFKTKGLIGVSIEPGFMMKGATGKSSIGNGYRSKLNYIQMPVFIDFYLFKEKLFFQLGPEVALLTNAKLNESNGNGYYDKKFELSAMAGVNFNIIRMLDVGIRYNYGITTTTDGEPKEFNNYIQLLLRLKFGNKEK